ncbi:putative Hepatic lectin protein [Naja naja]|nr:putative Hepatic lectin protein [Naja naja]
MDEEKFADDFRTYKVFPCGADNRQWEYFGGKCYFFSLKTIPWHEAMADCERRQSRLVIIDSLAKQNFIQTRTRNERYWIGLHDQHREGDWKWLDGRIGRKVNPTLTRVVKKTVAKFGLMVNGMITSAHLTAFMSVKSPDRAHPKLPQSSLSLEAECLESNLEGKTAALTS